jgi:hypothetical protein
VVIGTHELVAFLREKDAVTDELMDESTNANPSNTKACQDDTERPRDSALELARLASCRLEKTHSALTNAAHIIA